MTEIEIDITYGPVRVLPIPATFVDVQLLAGPCTLHGFSIRDTSAEVPLSTTGAVVSPAAGANISGTLSPATGTYLAQWIVELEGAAAAADADNFKLQFTGGVSIPSLNPGAAGVYPQDPVEIVIPSGGTANIAAIAAGTVGVTYRATLSLEPVAFSSSITELRDGNNALLEMSVQPGQADTRWFGDSGLKVRNEILLHPISGLITGAVYARFAKTTG